MNAVEREAQGIGNHRDRMKIQQYMKRNRVYFSRISFEFAY